MEPWLAIIKEFGFPAAVTFYLMHRIENKLNTLIASIHSLPEKLK
ncbi:MULTISPECIES: YvrJ family protein [Terribacillus]|jgi:YvrJ protein family|uniref:YvrJ family protein n=2 Tax=Terribacillus TaxID=459532 RepID=A0A1H8FHB2_9BACI|nr:MULTISPECIES: YvrJ family protein [Terribacillus]MCM3225271.1 YvrJ family protein [Terribacillus saccharophilus]MEC0302131.1 YvrJ family protein [Terribacillus saccharophilus]PAD22617.1 YvrJ family protein [Terribacillus saccharophilus]PAD35244.1 YvrJ family protein [Terribacillus saccharophilus]PAD95993.1 YvrJ family protein [Terribacillus saccharophilus]